MADSLISSISLRRSTAIPVSSADQKEKTSKLVTALVSGKQGKLRPLKVQTNVVPRIGSS